MLKLFWFSERQLASATVPRKTNNRPRNIVARVEADGSPLVEPGNNCSRLAVLWDEQAEKLAEEGHKCGVVCKAEANNHEQASRVRLEGQPADAAERSGVAPISLVPFPAWASKLSVTLPAAAQHAAVRRLQRLRSSACPLGFSSLHSAMAIAGAGMLTLEADESHHSSLSLFAC